MSWPPEGPNSIPSTRPAPGPRPRSPPALFASYWSPYFVSPGRRRSSLDGPGDRLDEPALADKEHEQHRHRGQGGAGHDGRPVGYEFTLERGEAHLDGERTTGRDRDQRPEQVVPRVDERDDAEGGQGRPREQQDQHHGGPPEPDAGERVSGQAAQDQLGDDRGAGHDQAVQEPVGKVR